MFSNIPDGHREQGVSSDGGDQFSQDSIGRSVPQELEATINSLTEQITTRLVKEHNLPSSAEFLSPEAVSLAGLSGITPNTNYFFPWGAAKAGESDHPIVKLAVAEQGLDRDILVAIHPGPLFEFLINRQRAAGALTKKTEAQVRDTGFVTTDMVTYVNFLDLYQETAQAFAAHAEVYQDGLVSLVSSMATERLLYQGRKPVGVVNPLLSIKGVLPEGLKIEITPLSASLCQSMVPGQTVLIPGAGYNMLGDLPVLLSCKDLKFILNEQDNFVSEVLKQTLKLIGGSNVSVENRDMGEAGLGENSIDVVILSQVHSIKPESAESFLKKMKSSLKPGSPIILCQWKEPGKKGGTSAKTWTDLFHKFDYNIDASDEFSVTTPTVLPDDDHEAALNMNAEEMAKLLHNRDPGKFKRTCSFIIGRTPPQERSLIIKPGDPGWSDGLTFP